MPRPSEVHVDQALSNISVAYRNDRLIADALIPAVPVVRESDSYFIYSRDNLRLQQTRRADTAQSNVATWHATTSTYRLEEEALHDYVSDRMKANAEPALSLEVDTTEFLTDMIQIRKESDLASLMNTTTNWANSASLSAGLSWTSDTVTSNPIVIINSVSSVLATMGKLPNTIALHDRLFRGAQQHQSIRDYIKYTSADSVTPQMLARLFNVDTVLVAGGIYNNTAENVFTTTGLGFIWPQVAWVAYVERAPGLRKLSAMYKFTKTGSPWEVRRWREEDRKSDAIEVSTMYQFKVVASEAAYLLNIA